MKETKINKLTIKNNGSSICYIEDINKNSIVIKLEDLKSIVEWMETCTK